MGLEAALKSGEGRGWRLVRASRSARDSSRHERVRFRYDRRERRIRPARHRRRRKRPSWEAAGMRERAGDLGHTPEAALEAAYGALDQGHLEHARELVQSVLGIGIGRSTDLHLEARALSCL